MTISNISLTWLHLSDIHFGNPHAGFDLENNISTLFKDLEKLQSRYGLRPDLIFISGDMAYGHSKNNSIETQYKAIESIIQKLSSFYDPPISLEDIFMVPGNHDVNRLEATEEQIAWIEALNEGYHACDKVDSMYSKNTRQWQRFMERLQCYKKFLRNAGFYHLLQDEQHLTYYINKNINSLTVGIAGLNTAWSSCRNGEKGQLWLSKSQIDKSRAELINSDIKIALSHHPFNWLNRFEDPMLSQQVENYFDFHLHGHEHEEWVTLNKNHVRIAASACYDSRKKISGYNIVRIGKKEHDKQCAELFLRCFDRKGGGWIPKIIYGMTSESGIWPIECSWLKPKSKEKQDLIAIATPKSLKLDICNYFTPACEVQDPKRFIGRVRELDVGIYALRSHGASIAIFGDAGVGKSSLAMRLIRIATGYESSAIHEANQSFNLNKKLPTIYYCCKNSDKDIISVFISLFRDSRPPHSLGYLLSKDNVSHVINKSHYRVYAEQLRQFYNTLNRGDEISEGFKNNVISMFANSAHVISEANNNEELLVVLDEFNLVKDKSGMANILKEYHFVKFILVGTAFDVRILVQDHGSIPRQIYEGQIRVHSMNQKELEQILHIEEDRSNNSFKFSRSAVNLLVKISSGMPFYTHYLGRYALAEAICEKANDNDKKKVINVLPYHVEKAVENGVIGIADLDKQYLDIIRNVWKRELLLKLLSCRPEDEIETLNIFEIARSQGVAKPSTQIKHFVRGNVLQQTGPKSYRFLDTRFKVFIRLRPFIFDDTKRRFNHFREIYEKRKAIDHDWEFGNLGKTANSYDNGN